MADVTSANIVGYSQNQLRWGASMVAPQFLNVGANKDMPLQSILPVGDNIDTEGSVTIQTLDSAGRDIDTYQWIDWGGDETGWMDGEYKLVEGVTFPAGTGLWINGNSTDDNIQTSGEVGLEDVVVQLRWGATPTGNPFPVPLDLQNILPEGESIDTEGSITIQTLDSAGRDIDTYQWIDWGGDETGWMDGEYKLVEGVTFPAGTGLWINGNSTADYIRFPAPKL